MNLSITFVGLIQLLGLLAAYQLGRQTATPEKEWPRGTLLEFGWQAWRMPLWVIVGMAAAITLFLPVFSGGLGMFGGMGGGYSGGYAGY